MKQQFAAKHPWTILAAGAAIQVLTGLPAAWGVFQQPVMEEYGLSEQGAGYAFALLIAAFGVGCVLGGFLQDKKGPRCAALWGTALLCGGFFAAAFLPGWAGWGFFLAFSIPAGLGTAFLYPSIQSCAQKWYAGRKGLATGVIGGAVGLSGAFLTLFVRAALRGFGPVQGIRGAFWALGALTLPVCLAGSAVLSDPPQKKQQPSGKNTLDLSPGQMLRTKQYWLCAGAVCFSTPAVLLFSPIILKLGMERGLDETAALWSIVLGSVGSAAGRMLMPMLSDHIGRRATDLGLFAASLGLSAAFWAARGWWVVVCYAGLTFCYSALAAVLPALSTDLFGLPHAGVNYGFLALGQSVGSLLLQDPPQDAEKQQKNDKNAIDLSPWQMLRTRQYWRCAGAVCFSTPAVLLFSPIILKLGMERGLDENAALWAVVLGSVGSAAGRMLMPMLSDHIGRRATDLGLFAASLGLSAAFWTARGWWVVVCYAGLTFCYSALAAVLPALSTDLFGLPHAGVNYGFLALGQSVGSLAFPFAANLLALENGRHLLAMAGAAAGFAAIWALHPVQKDPR